MMSVMVFFFTYSDTKWNRPIKCPKSWRKVYDNINVYLKEYFKELRDIPLEQNDLEFDEMLSNLSTLKLVRFLLEYAFLVRYYYVFH